MDILISILILVIALGYFLYVSVSTKSKKEGTREVIINTLTSLGEGVVYGLCIGAVLAVIVVGLFGCNQIPTTHDNSDTDSTAVRVDGTLTPEPDTIKLDTLN
jgi:hypothetical protein